MVRYLRVVLVLTILAGVLTSCFTSYDVVAFCDHITVSYTDDGQGQWAAIVVTTEGGHEAATYLYQGPPSSEPYSGSFTIPLDDNYPDGTKFNYAIYTYSPDYPTDTGSETCSTSGHHVTWFDPGDSRLNRQAYAYAAIYCDDANQRVAIYGIHAQATDGKAPGEGFPAIFVPYGSLPPTPTAEQGNTLIQQYLDIGFYRLTTGEYQVNAGPDSEGKTYVVTFDGCPTSIMRAYIMQNGVMTQTEVYPHQ